MSIQAGAARGRPVPRIAFVVAAGTALALVILFVQGLQAHGLHWFFREGDASYYRATALDPFGTARAFFRAGAGGEAPYRYGRIGFPLSGWVLGLGQPGLIPWTLIVVQLAATAAVPGLACVLAGEYGAPPIVGVAVLLSPLVFLLGFVFAEPLMISLVFLAYILESRQRHRSALVVFACAVLVKETAIIALVPWVWSALRKRDLQRVGGYLATLLPYAAWCVVVRVRIGEFPFLADTISRTNAMGLPGVGIRYALSEHTPDHVSVVSLVLATIGLCCIAAFAGRRLPIGGLAAALALLVACLGDNALRYSEETLRLLIFPIVVALLCIAVGAARAWISRFGTPGDPSQRVRSEGSGEQSAALAGTPTTTGFS